MKHSKKCFFLKVLNQDEMFALGRFNNMHFALTTTTTTTVNSFPAFSPSSCTFTPTTTSATATSTTAATTKID